MTKRHCNIDKQEDRGVIHRDYIAHCFRWSHAVREIRRIKRPRVLDAGCGPNTPLARVLYVNQVPIERYCGVDSDNVSLTTIIPVESPWHKRFQVVSNTDIVQFENSRPYDIVVCFEVLDMLSPIHAYQTLNMLSSHLTSLGKLLVSVASYDPAVGAGPHHTNEMRPELVQFIASMLGLRVTAQYGTFISQRDYIHDLTSEQRELYDELHGYYDTDTLSTFFAPLFPLRARNVIYHIDTNAPEVSMPALKRQWENVGSGYASSAAATDWKDFVAFIEDKLTLAPSKKEPGRPRLNPKGGPPTQR